MTSARKTRDGSCHCGAVRFTVELINELRNPRRCDCSLCRMRGAVVVSAEVGNFQVRQGFEVLATYQFNTMAAKHHFCRTCGIYTHHQRRSNPDQYGVNVACLDGVSPYDFAEVPVNNGLHHPSDASAGVAYLPVVGVLRYVLTREPVSR